MHPSQYRRRPLLASAAVVLAISAAIFSIPKSAFADEDGTSFWIPGLFGSLAAAPQQPGWSLTSILYNTNVSASGNAAVAREITIGRFNPKINISVNANVHANFTLGLVAPTYVFATPFLGGQASATLLFGYGNNDTSLNASATASTDRLPFSITRSVALSQDTAGFTDLIPLFEDRWNAGVNNYMVYITGDIPVGLYSTSNLANIGLGHGAIDGGVGYTYFNGKTGHEFSAVLGFTGNFEPLPGSVAPSRSVRLVFALREMMPEEIERAETVDRVRPLENLGVGNRPRRVFVTRAPMLFHRPARELVILRHALVALGLVDEMDDVVRRLVGLGFEPFNLGALAKIVRHGFEGLPKCVARFLRGLEVVDRRALRK